jgi:hypothetical protein
MSRVQSSPSYYCQRTLKYSQQAQMTAANGVPEPAEELE